MKRILFEPRSRQMFMLAMEAAGWLNEHLEEWLGEKNVADTLTQGASDGVGFAARRTTKADAMSRRRVLKEWNVSSNSAWVAASEATQRTSFSS
jgi:hypothetical protein